MRFSHIFAVVGLSACASVGGAQTLILGFEGATPALSNSSPSTQSHNGDAGPRAAAQNTNATFITQGTASLRITNTWTLPGVSLTDEWEPGRPNQLCWAIRAHYAGSTPISTAYTRLEADLYNAGTEALDAAIVLNDGAYKRGPWVSLAPGAWTKVSWELSDPGAPAVTGGASGALNRASTVFRGFGFHRGPSQVPTSPNVDVYIDNLVGFAGQADTTPPAPPTLLKVEQGSAPGTVKATWLPNDAGDGVAKYTIHYLNAASWQRTAQNRISTNVIATSVDVAGAASTTGEIAVPTGEVCYIMITATDGATPVANTSGKSQILAVRLNADGSVPKNLVVLDNKRYTSNDLAYTTNGYEQMAAYYGVALSTNNESFVSCVSSAVAGGQQTLTPGDDQVVIWSTGLDGNTPATALSVANVNALTTYVNGNGNLLLTGANVGDGLFSAAAPAELTAFAQNVVKADLVTTDAASKDITGLGGPFASVGDIATGTDAFYAGAGSITANDALAARAGATATGTLGAGSAIIYSGKVVTFGFGVEQVRDPSADTPDAAASTAGHAKRAALLGAAVNYLRTTSSVNDWSLY